MTAGAATPSRLGERDAITKLSHALPRLPADFVRARAGMLVDLAYAYAAAGQRDAALAHARQAKQLASQIKSDRQLRRLAALVLPPNQRVKPLGSPRQPYSNLELILFQSRQDRE